MDIRKRICEILATVFGVEAEAVQSRPDEESLGTLGLDSLNCMDIVVSLEEAFGIVFEDEELLLESLNTVGKLERIVGDKLNRLAAKGG
ncbi:acyl carrier protein [Gorillibacterium sp. sgz500922]|uniref:acyl carrier protein n=1 Tax=Gorillibacterium sp. sgz500922 TaxID=3446694 RepID=UPI003F66A3C9